ncbi:MAG: hypothetical protein K2O45_15445 [Oscillospiraceae bacterium]|nr:hypothetical protein [Oscillospiraceae bacterium]
MGTLEKIYNGDYDLSKASENLPFSLRLKERAFWDAIEEGMGKAFIERHWDSLCKIEHFRDYANFREGFRLGVSLMMELM